MVSFFGKKRDPMVVPGKEVPLGPPNLTPPDEYAEEEPGIKEQVGYPSEESYETKDGEPLPPTEGEPSYAYEGEQQGSFEGAEPPAESEYPPFLPQPGAAEAMPAAETYAQEDIEKIARDIADEVRQEFEEKIKGLNAELDELRKLDKEMEKMYDTFEKLNEKYTELEDKISELPTKTQEDLSEIKATVNSINQIMSSALPALIKEVRELKPQK